MILAVLGPGDTLGEMSPLDDVGRSANVVTLDRCDCLWVEGPAFQEALVATPRLAVNLVRLLVARLRLANAQIQALSTLDVRGRVARQLLAFAEQYGRRGGEDGETRIPLRLTQRDLAELVGASRERVNRVLTGFRERGYISLGPGYEITIHDRPSLVARCY